MIDINVKCKKINEYLNSFLSDGNKTTNNNEEDSNHLNNKSNAKVVTFQTSKLSVTDKNNSQNASIKTHTLPNNVEEFHRRLKSFESGLWTCRAVSPLLCASYGWKLVDKIFLSCVTCKALICTTLPLPNQLEAYENFSKKLKNRLRFGHKDWCEWSNNPSPPDFLHPPLHMTHHFSNILLRKVDNILGLGIRIPYIKCDEMLRKLGLQKREISRFFAKQSELSPNHLTAAVLVLCGWDSEGQGKLKCSLCFRSIGLWSWLSLSEGSHYEELEKRNNEREERRKIIEERKKERERKLLIKEEKLKTKLLKEKKAAEEEVLAKEKALKVKLALETISKLESSDLSNPSEESESDEEMGEEDEKNLLSEDGNTLMMEEENISISEPICTSNISVATSPQNKIDETEVVTSHSTKDSPSFSNVVLENENSNAVIENEDSNASLENEDCDAIIENEDSDAIIENEESRSPETPHVMVHAETEVNFESDECSKSYNGNGSDDDLWLEAVGGYVEENGSNVAKSNPSSPSSEESENIVDYPVSSSNRKRRRSDSSEDNYIEEEIDSKCRRVEEVYEAENSFHIDTNENSSSNRKRRRSDSSEDNYIEEEITSKYRKVEEVYEGEDSLQIDTNENTMDNDSIANSESRNSNQNPTEEINENSSSLTGAKDNKSESTEEEDIEEEIEEIEEDTEEIAMLNKMRKSVFEPLEQHRHWCGWIVDHSSLYIDEVDTSGEGFKILPPQISQSQPDLPDSSIVTSEKYAGNVIGVRTVRGILDSWAVEKNEDSEEEEL